MNTFDRNHLKNIKDIFEDKTGISLTARKSVRRPIRTTAIIIALIACCLSVTAWAVTLFSPLSGDELTLNATYDGDGIVSVSVDNLSDKQLCFQPRLKLVQWTTGEEIEPLSNQVIFSNTAIPAHSSRIMTIDLSNAYDMEALEKPLTDDGYYFVLTNNHFVFGQDWMCSVTFAQSVITAGEPADPAEVEPAIIQSIAQSLQFYFKSPSYAIEQRRALDTEYKKAYTELFDAFEGNIISSVSPVLPGNRMDPAMPYLTVQDPAPGIVFDGSVALDGQLLLVGSQWQSCDANFKLLATDGEHALTLSAQLPLQKYADSTRGLPLFYILSYEKTAIESQEDFAFIYGRLLQFADLEKNKIYEDSRYVCYEVSNLVYSDLAEYTKSFVGQNPDVRFDDQVWKRVERIYTYYKENLKSLLYYKSTTGGHESPGNDPQ